MSTNTIPRIPEYFAGRTIFLTGGSGFLGKVLIEKLLRSCPKIKAIYVLLREKKGKNLHERFEELTNLVIFDRVKIERPGMLEKKLHFVRGDVRELGLGLSDEDRKLLEENVDIVFHAAATVRFDESFKDAVIMNTRGTREAIQLASNMKNLKVFVHVSTTYCNTDRKDIFEEIYPPHADWRKTIELAEKYDEEVLNILTLKYMGSLPNTYTFTKSLAEHVVNDLGNGKFPVVLFRPSIVISSLREPFPGWIDNFNGPVGILVASGKGIMRTVYSDPDLIADFMPVDVSIKALLVATWKKGIESEKTRNELVVYNSSSSSIKYVTMGDIVKLGLTITDEIPLNDELWTPGGCVTNSRALNYIKVLLFHFLPAFFIDIILKCLGKNFSLLKIQRKIYIANMALQYFITNQWNFHNNRCMGLENDILDKDVNDWSFDFSNEDVYDYFMNCMRGGKQYLLNESFDDLPKARIHHRRMYWIDKAVRAVFWIFVIYLLIKVDVYGKFTNLLSRSKAYLVDDF